MKTAIAYIRRSKESNERTISLDDQLRQVSDYARAQGWELAAVVRHDGVSGGKRARFDRIREAIAETDADVVLVTNMDRFARDAAGALEEIDRFTKRGVQLHVVGRGRVETSTATGFLTAGIESLLAEHYRRLVSEKTRSALALKRDRGERTGEVPFGFRVAADGRTLEQDDAEQAIVAIIRELRAAGSTLRTIADALNAQGMTTRRGTPWRLQYVDRVLKTAA